MPGLLPRRVTIEPGDRVVVTGASGFIGSAVARAVRSRGAHVVALTEPGADCRTLAGVDAERVAADIRDRAAVQAACAGARFVFHLAAIYRFWARDPRVFYDVNVGGTLNVLAAVRAAGCERLVYTSTIGVLDPRRAGDGRPGDETCYADLALLHGSYKGSKFVAEHEVLRACAGGLDACLVLPTFPLGPGDAAPTPTGRVVLDYLNGRMPGFADTAMNVVHVDDLAAGHVAALERGASGPQLHPRRREPVACGTSLRRSPAAPACRCHGCTCRGAWSSRPASPPPWSRAGCCAAHRACRSRQRACPRRR